MAAMAAMRTAGVFLIIDVDVCWRFDRTREEIEQEAV